MKKVLIITYYWPPSGGSGVQRWMYFCRYLSAFNIHPVVITVDETKASYRFLDESFREIVEGIETYKTKTIEPLKFYSKIISGDKNTGIPIGFAGESKPGFFQKISRAIRGNFFIPDARKGWVKFALKKAIEVLNSEDINLVVTTGPPHSSHLIGMELKKRLNINWIADFRDPWTDLHYNKFLFRTKYALKKDANYEQKVLKEADSILTIGPSMKQHLMIKGCIPENKVHYILNGYDESDFKNTVNSNNPDYFTISHIGMLSDTQPITAFLLALKSFFDQNHPICKHLKLRLIGNVSPKNKEEVNHYLPQLSTEHIGYVQKNIAISYMMSSDLLFNSLAEMENSELLISGKLMEYIAAGKSILCLGNPKGDAAHLLNDFKSSKVFDRKNPELIIPFLNSLFDNWLNKVNFVPNVDKVKQYSRFETTRQLANLLNKYL